MPPKRARCAARAKTRSQGFDGVDVGCAVLDLGVCGDCGRGRGLGVVGLGDCAGVFGLVCLGGLYRGEGDDGWDGCGWRGG